MTNIDCVDIDARYGFAHMGENRRETAGILPINDRMLGTVT